DRGSTWSRCSSESLPAKRSGAARSPRSRTSSPPSKPSSTPGTTAANPSCGPRPPTKSSPKLTVKSLQTRDTRLRILTRERQTRHAVRPLPQPSAVVVTVMDPADVNRREQPRRGTGVDDHHLDVWPGQG